MLILLHCSSETPACGTWLETCKDTHFSLFFLLLEYANYVVCVSTKNASTNEINCYIWTNQSWLPIGLSCLLFQLTKLHQLALQQSPFAIPGQTPFPAGMSLSHSLSLNHSLITFSCLSYFYSLRHSLIFNDKSNNLLPIHNLHHLCTLLPY